MKQTFVDKNHVEFIDIINAKQEISFELSNASDKTIVFLLSPKESLKITLSVYLKGRYSNARIIGIVIPERIVDIELFTSQIHESPDTASVCMIRSVMLNDSFLSYQGNILIGKKAKGSDAFQHHDSLLLSPKAKVKTRPVLEILQNAVSCKHGVTIHPIPEDLIWYAKTRSLRELQIKKMYIDGCIKKSIEIIPDSHIKNLVYNRCRKIIDSYD
jgi:Fe-S cluster assembly protein SufD